MPKCSRRRGCGESGRVLCAAETERSVCTDIFDCWVGFRVIAEFIWSDWQFVTVIRRSKKPWEIFDPNAKNFKGYKTPQQTLEKGHTQTVHPHRHMHTHQQAGRHVHTQTHRHLQANADTQTLVHCSLKLSLCVDFSGLLNLVWGQRRCPLHSFMPYSRFFWGRRDGSNTSHGHGTIR